MNCCQCQGIEDVFNEKAVAQELDQYRARGPKKTTRMMVEALKAENPRGYSLLDIGGGVGAIQHELLAAGVAHSAHVEASQAYLQAAQREARRRGLDGRIDFLYGDFVALAGLVAPADIVTLDRVLCCYHDLLNMVALSAARAKKLYGLVYPRFTWWTRAGAVLMNLIFRLQKNPYRAFIHADRQVEDLLHREGFQRRFYRQSGVWQVVLYSRE